jgi:hypothetical protein
MTPAEFLKQIVSPNVAALGDNCGDIRLGTQPIGSQQTLCL